MRRTSPRHGKVGEVSGRLLPDPHPPITRTAILYLKGRIRIRFCRLIFENIMMYNVEKKEKGDMKQGKI